MKLDRLGVIGAGAIANVVLSTLARDLPKPLAQVSILVPEREAAKARAMLDHLGERLARSRVVHKDVAEFLSGKPSVVAECASQTAVVEFGPAILRAGCDLVVISIGALSSDATKATLVAAAEHGGAQIVLPAGAIGGIDALGAARLSGLEALVYTGRKPPVAWRGTRAETLLDLEALTEPVTFFQGSAREAAQDYPFNANVAATLALAGCGLERTQVQLVADPGVTRNVHEFSVSGGCGDFTVRLQGRPSPANPKTSLMAGYSVARELLNRTATIVI
jgi:aspartate dehydrogenase